MHWIDEVLALALQRMPIAVDKQLDSDQGKKESDAIKIVQQGNMAH